MDTLIVQSFKKQDNKELEEKLHYVKKYFPSSEYEILKNLRKDYVLDQLIIIPSEVSGEPPYGFEFVTSRANKVLDYLKSETYLVIDLNRILKKYKNAVLFLEKRYGSDLSKYPQQVELLGGFDYKTALKFHKKFDGANFPKRFVVSGWLDHMHCIRIWFGEFTTDLIFVGAYLGHKTRYVGFNEPLKEKIKEVTDVSAADLTFKNLINPIHAGYSGLEIFPEDHLFEIVDTIVLVSEKSKWLVNFINVLTGLLVRMGLTTFGYIKGSVVKNLKEVEEVYKERTS